jgi:hypothetical protein
VALEEPLAALQVALAEQHEPALPGEVVDPVVADERADPVEHVGAQERPDRRGQPGADEADVTPGGAEAGEGQDDLGRDRWEHVLEGDQRPDADLTEPLDHVDDPSCEAPELVRCRRGHGVQR